MANLTPVNSFDNVIQLETNTIALGGVGGIMNAQAQALLNRTAYLNSALANKLDASSTTDTVTEGSTNLYFTETRVRNTVLTDISLATNAVISAADNVLSALGKLQKQISDILSNQRYQFVADTTTADPTYTVPASAVTENGRTIIELSNNSLTSITINAATGTGKVAGDSVNISITGTYAAQILEASGVTLQGDLTFSYQYQTKTLVYKGSNVWKVVG